MVEPLSAACRLVSRSAAYLPANSSGTVRAVKGRPALTDWNLGAAPRGDISRAVLTRQPRGSTRPGDGRPFLWDRSRSELTVRTLTVYAPPRRFSVRLRQGAGA